MKVIILGAPGSGKGTISKELVNQYHFVHLSTGDLFRKTIAENGPMANELKNIITSGQLVSDDITNEVAKNEILKLVDQQKDFILDGYPRTIDQAQFLNKIVQIDVVILIDIDFDVLIKRIAGRRTCSVCGTIYNTYFMPTKVAGICDKDQGILLQRKDDDPNIAETRIRVYEKQTAPLIKYYIDKGILHKVNGNQPLEQLLHEIKLILKK